MCQFYKRLDRGTFQLPERERETDRHVEVDDATLEALLDGIAVETETKKPRATHLSAHTHCDRNCDLCARGLDRIARADYGT
jgi:hypothetical protein